MAHGFLLILPLVLAIALIRRGFRGAAIDDHPLCRVCGFDLFGQPAGTTFCGECGRDLSKQNAIVIGHRVKRRKSLALGITLLIIFTTSIGIFGYGRATHVNWWRCAPLWYVLREASSTDPGWRTPAITELTARFTDGRLSASQWDRVADAGLAYQGDLSKAWDPAWGHLIELGWNAGKLSDAQWHRYAGQVIYPGLLSIKVPPEMHRGQRVGYSIFDQGERIGLRSVLCVETDQLKVIWADGTALDPGVGSMTDFGWGTVPTSPHEKSSVDLGVQDLPPNGPQIVRATAVLMVGPRPPNSYDVIPLATLKVEFRATTTIVGQ